MMVISSIVQQCGMRYSTQLSHRDLLASGQQEVPLQSLHRAWRDLNRPFCNTEQQVTTEFFSFLLCFLHWSICTWQRRDISPAQPSSLWASPVDKTGSIDLALTRTLLHGSHINPGFELQHSLRGDHVRKHLIRTRRRTQPNPTSLETHSNYLHLTLPLWIGTTKRVSGGSWEALHGGQYFSTLPYLNLHVVSAHSSAGKDKQTKHTSKKLLLFIGELVIEL